MIRNIIVVLAAVPIILAQDAHPSTAPASRFATTRPTTGGTDPDGRSRQLAPLGAVPPNPANPDSPEKTELGRLLFFDPILSGSNRMACATCHRPDLGWADGKRFSNGDGEGAAPLARHTPSLLNVAYNLTQFWDGRAGTLEEQALQPVTNPAEMNQPLPELVAELQAAGYGPKFAAVFGEPLSTQQIALALAAFERTIVMRNTRYDRWLRGEDGVLSDAAARGLLLFATKGRCTACHSGPNLTNAAHRMGTSFVRLGVKSLPGDPPDPGRAGALPPGSKEATDSRQIGAFKIPPLRGVAATAPYMHNGSLATLEEVIDFYDRGGDEGRFKPLGLTALEKRWLVTFLQEGLSE